MLADAGDVDMAEPYIGRRPSHLACFARRMKTTVVIADSLFAWAQRVAEARGITLKGAL